MSDTTYKMNITLMDEKEYKEYSDYVEGTEALNVRLQYWRFIYTAVCKSVNSSDPTHLSRALMGAHSLGYTRDTETLMGGKYLKLALIWPRVEKEHHLTRKTIKTFPQGNEVKKLTTKGKDRLKQLKDNNLKLVKELFDLFLEGKEIEKQKKERKAPDYVKSLERLAAKDDCPQELAVMILATVNAYKKKIAETPQHAVH